MLHRNSVRALAAGAFLSVPAAAFAHGDEIEPGQGFWSLWHWSPEIIAALLVAGWVYARGLKRGKRPPWPRIVSFYAALLAFFIALISPVERLADHIFAVHQVEHMLLRTIGPLFLFLAIPQAVLTRGLSRGARSALVGPVARSGWLHALLGFLRKPVVATLLFVGVSWIWMVPPWHDLAILNEAVHYSWHISLVLTGLIFFSVLLDPHPAPAGPGIGTRMAMFVAAAFGNISLGATLSFKTQVLYTAYDHLGRMWDVAPIVDEQIGGLVMWIPGCMMFGLAAGIMLFRFGEEEKRTVERRQREDRMKVRDPVATSARNRRLALSLGGFAAMVLMLAVAIVSFLIQMEHRAVPGAVAGAPPHESERHI